MPTGTCSITEFLQRLRQRGEACHRDASPDSTALSQRKSIDWQNICTKELAAELDIWLPLSELDSLGVPMPGGVENTVYYNSAEDMMYKMNNLMTSGSIINLFNRLLLHNEIFPQTSYALVAFTGFPGGATVYPIIKQQYVPNATYATHGEILDYMESLGFVPVSEGKFQNDTYIVSDLRPRNVLKTASGCLFVVDADFKLK